MKQIKTLTVEDHEKAIHEIRMDRHLSVEKTMSLIKEHEEEIERLIREEEEKYFKW